MMYALISGALMMTCLSAGLFFFKFWQRSREKLFLRFAVSFWLLGLERLVLGYQGTDVEPRPEIYCIRLLAFLMILFAVVQKNRETKVSEF